MDVQATTALDGAEQVLLTQVLGRPHHDLVAGAIHQRVNLKIQDGGAQGGHLVGDRLQGPGLVVERDTNSPE